MPGIVTLSIELELGWGMHDKGRYAHLSPSRNAETRALRRLLRVADEYQIPITFDIVGHLFHESCSGFHDGPHPRCWWRADPGTNQKTDPLFYAPDLVEGIRSQPLDHEIATHTYSHLLAEHASPAELDYELACVKELHDSKGISAPSSIVMPRHQNADRSVLQAHGINTIRRPIDGYEQSFSNPLSKLRWLLTRCHPESSIRTRDGLTETTVTTHPSLSSSLLPVGQSDPHPVITAIPLSIRQYLHRRYLFDAIDRAAEGDAHVHLWTHVYNIANEKQWGPLEDGLEYMAEQRDNDAIQIRPMCMLSGYG